MKTSRKQELKGAFKAIVAIAVLGLMIGIGVATTLMSDEGFFKDGNEILVEGDYTTWTKVWNESLVDGLAGNDKIAFYIDEKNEFLYLAWYDGIGNNRFGIFNLADFSAVFNSSPGAQYLSSPPYVSNERSYGFGAVSLYEGGVSRSLQTYMLLSRNGDEIIEVWRSGSSVLWSRNVTLDNNPAGAAVYSGLISSTGKWIVVFDSWDTKLVCYEGS